MLEGITILAKNPIMTKSRIGIVIGIILSIIALVLFLYGIIKESIVGSIFCILFVSASVFIGSNDMFFMEPTGKYEYKCTINNKVDLKTFAEKYEVISLDGDLWTIRDKETK